MAGSLSFPLPVGERREAHDSIGVLPFACQNDTMGGPFMPMAAVSKTGGAPQLSVQKLSKERSGGGNDRFHGSRIPSYLWPVPAGEGAGPPVAGPRGAQRAPALPGRAAVSGRASRAPGHQSRDAPARVGRDACQ